MAELIAAPNELIYRWLAERSGLVRVEDFLGIARRVDGRIVAAFGYDHHQDSSCMFHVAAEPGGIDREMLRRGFWVPFVQWGYSCLIGVIQSKNSKSLEIAARLGFTQRLVLPGAHPSGALHWWVMYRNECPWLQENKNNERRRKRTPGTEPVGEHE